MNRVVVDAGRIALIVARDGDFVGEKAALTGNTASERINVKSVGGVRHGTSGRVGIYVAALCSARQLVIKIGAAGGTEVCE